MSFEQRKIGEKKEEKNGWNGVILVEWERAVNKAVGIGKNEYPIFAMENIGNTLGRISDICKG